MVVVQNHIKDGAKTFLKEEYSKLAIFCAFFAIILAVAVDQPWVENEAGDKIAFPMTTMAFLVGAATSMLCGYIGMVVATDANAKVTSETTNSIGAGFNVAFMGGQVLGFCLVGIALLLLQVLIMIYKPIVLNSTDPAIAATQVRVLFEYISGYGLGGSTVALFGRVGGGIYTKAADVGADLAGKVTIGLEEDSPLNPGTIADNVGDNVGDIAGMGADLFGSLAEATCAALVVSATSDSMTHTPDAIYFPLVITAAGVAVSFMTIWFVNCWEKVDAKLFWQIIISTVLMTGAIVPILYMLPQKDDILFEFGGEEYNANIWHLYACIMMGLWSGMIIGAATEYYTSNKYAPTRDLADQCHAGAAPNIIMGLALGYMSCVIPVFCLSATILVAFSFAAMYGIGLAALGMLGVLPVALTIDGYGPISDNAGGVAEMSNCHPKVRELTDELDAAGNTTAAIGKGFAIGSACLVALALFGAFITRVEELQLANGGGNVTIDILDPYTFAGLLFGAMLPYAFSALTMAAVGRAANDMIKEIQAQFPNIMNGGKPDHEKCIAISTKASLSKMIAPGAIVIISPLAVGMLFGYQATAGLLAGIIVSGIQIAFSASNTGGAWDNCKKMVEAGKLERNAQQIEFANANEAALGKLPENVRKFGTIVKKKDPEHAAAVIGDTVGDPLKDTSGPSINILVKLSAITSLVFGSFIAKTSLRPISDGTEDAPAQE
jgi:inorganic pyrophosphatase